MRYEYGMPRIQPVDPAAAPEPVREALGQLPDLNIFKTLAHAETAFRPFLRFGGAILGKLELDPKLRELAILQVARDAEAEYEWVQHAAIAEAIGVPAAQIDAIQAGDLESFEDPERAVLELAAAMVAGPRVSDALFARLRGSFDDRQIVELLLTAGDYLMLARVMTVLEIELDEPAGSAVVERAGS
jgi:alkylhydroperoxidase family enzyme